MILFVSDYFFVFELYNKQLLKLFSWLIFFLLNDQFPIFDI